MRVLLLILVGFAGISAFITGLLMLNYPDGTILGVPPDMIQASPFNNLVVPGIILGFGVGGVNLMALYHFMDPKKQGYDWATAGGVVTCGWVAVQFTLIHSILWVQAIYLLAGLATILLSLQLKNKWLV